MTHYDNNMLRVFFESGAFNLREYIVHAFLKKQLLNINDAQSINTLSCIFTRLFECILTLHKHGVY